jgi:hypothetical protein
MTPIEERITKIRDDVAKLRGRGIVCEIFPLSDLELLLAQVEEMGARLEATKQDTERLNRWEAQRTRTLAPVMDAEGWHLAEPTVLVRIADDFAPTLREAIDAALTSSSPATDGTNG